MNQQPLLLRWRALLASEHGPASSTTRHVLLTLSLNMDQEGGSCFPSTATLKAMTGLSERAVCEHLGHAADDGWIERRRVGTGRAWKRMTYQAKVPRALTDVQHDRADALTEDQHDPPRGADGGSAPSPRGTDSDARGTDSHDIEALTEGQSISPKNSPDNSISPSTTEATSDPAEPDHDEAVDVEAVWQVWIEELGGDPPHPELSTGDRRKLLRTLIAEQLEPRREEHDPLDVMRKLCRAVKASDHHMSKRQYHLPESIFRNAKRREFWVLEGLSSRGGGGGSGRPPTAEELGLPSEKYNPYNPAAMMADMI